MAATASGTSSLRIWLMAARIRTLPAAVAPVLVGTAFAATGGTFKPLSFIAALIGALFIQVGTNLSNDYSDARRGADTDDRLGPVRVTAGGLVPPRQVLVATYVAFAVAVLAGTYLIATAGWELLLVGAASILAGVLYTGGPRPYGYEGLGEVFVFLFFGIVAVAGSYFAQRQGDHRCVHGPRAVAAEAHRERLLVRPPVRVHVADVVDDQDRRRQQPDGDRQRERLPRQLLDLYEERPGDGDDAEEEEDEHLAEPGVAVWPWPSRVEDAGENREHPDDDDHRARHRGEVDPGSGRDPKRDPGRDEDAPGRDQAGRGHPHRPEPIDGVGAPLRVRVIVDEVGPDLDEDAADEGRDEGTDAG